MRGTAANARVAVRPVTRGTKVASIMKLAYDVTE